MKNIIYLAVVVATTSLTACKGKHRAPDPVKPVATKVGVTIMVAGKTEETPDAADPNKTFLSGDFGGIDLEVVPAEPPPDAIKGPGGKPLVNAKVEKLADGFLITYGDKTTSFGVESFRTVGGKVIRCATNSNPFDDRQEEIAIACKSIK